MAVELGLGSTQFQSLGLLPVSQQKKMDRNKYFFFIYKKCICYKSKYFELCKIIFSNFTCEGNKKIYTYLRITFKQSSLNPSILRKKITPKSNFHFKYKNVELNIFFNKLRWKIFFLRN